MSATKVVSFDEKAKEKLLAEIRAELEVAVKPVIDLLQRRCQLEGKNPEETLERCKRFTERLYAVMVEFR